MTSESAKTQFQDAFGSVTDPRVARTRRHNLLDILFIALTAMISGADDYVTIAEYGRIKLSWFKKLLELPNGIPSHDTFQRVFARLDPQQLEKCLVSWSEQLRLRTDVKGEEVIALDGKVLRHSFDNALGVPAIHIVSAWASRARLCLGQVKVTEKSNEITAVPVLLKMLDIEDCLVTADALNCQKATAEQITQQGGVFVLALKDNQPNLFEDVKLFIEHAAKNKYADHCTRTATTCDKGHNRIETRNYRLIDLPDGIAWADEKKAWPGLKSIGIARCTRQIGDKITTETRYYLTAIPTSTANSANRFARGSRYHWGIENSLHWCLDMCFNEDNCRVHKDYGPQNLAVLRHIALNLLKRDTTTKAGIKTRRLKAGWSEPYLEHLIMN
jgi:predicted transposase YbfD/YdcC